MGYHNVIVLMEVYWGGIIAARHTLNINVWYLTSRGGDHLSICFCVKDSGYKYHVNEHNGRQRIYTCDEGTPVMRGYL